MTQYKIVSGYGFVGDGKVYDEHPKFGHYKTGLLTYVCLVTGEHQSKYYALSNLREVEQPAIQGCALPPFMTEMLYTCALPPFWTEYLYTCAEPPALVVTLTPDLAANVNHAIGVSIQVVESSKAPVTLFDETMVSNAA